jgi:hypothetical protein
MTTTETDRRRRLSYRERLAEQTGLDREALAVLYDESGNRRRFEVLGGRLVAQPIMERSPTPASAWPCYSTSRPRTPAMRPPAPARCGSRTGSCMPGTWWCGAPKPPWRGSPSTPTGTTGCPSCSSRRSPPGRPPRTPTRSVGSAPPVGWRVAHYWVADLRRGAYLLYAGPAGEDYADLTEVADRAALRLPPELA